MEPKVTPSVTHHEQWEKAAAHYQTLVGRCTSHGTKRLVDVVHQLDPFTKESYTLDVGAGAGSLTFAVHEKNADTRILATDIAAPMLEQIDEKAVPVISTQCEDAMTLSGLTNDSFTHSMSTFTIQFTTDPATAMKNIYRVTVPGGTVGVAIWGERVSLNDAHSEACRRLKPDYQTVFPFSEGSWRDEAAHKVELQRAGLHEVAVETIQMPIEPGSARGATEFWFYGTNPLPHMLIDDWIRKGGSAEELEREFEKIIEEDYEGGRALYVDGVLGWGRKPDIDS